jgi:hypothetical protein
MKIKTCKLRAANEFRAKGDIRNYLNGIRINKDSIQATNGHIAISMDSEIKSRMDIIVRFIGAIPKSAVETKLTFSASGNVAYHYDQMKGLISVQVFHIEDGRFPDFKKIIPDESEFELSGKFPILNAQYMAVAFKAFGSKKDKFIGMKPIKYDGANKSVIYSVTGIQHGEYGNPIIVIMPMRE